MNVKITYTIPFETVPNKVNDLLVEAGRTLEGLGAQVRPIQFEEDDQSIIQKLDKIDKMRKELMSIDLLLEDCYTILAGYNKALADMRMPQNAKQEQTYDGMAEQGGSSVYPSKSTDG